MLKKRLSKIVGTFLAVSMFAVSAEAAQINMIIDTSSGAFAEPEKVYEQIDETVRGWFFPSEEEMKSMTFSERQALKNSSHVLVPIADSDATVQIYREENGLVANYDYMVAGVQARDMSMSKDDLANLSTKLGADYILYFRITNSMPTFSGGFMSAGQKVNVVTDFRVWDAKQKNYTFVKRYQTKGSSSTFYAGGAGSTTRAIEKGLKKALEQIDEDKGEVLAVVK